MRRAARTIVIVMIPLMGINQVVLASPRDASPGGNPHMKTSPIAEPAPSLAFLTRKAIRVLKQAYFNSTSGTSGFFLLIEGSQIDWTCHANAVATNRPGPLFDWVVEAGPSSALKEGAVPISGPPVDAC